MKTGNILTSCSLSTVMFLGSLNLSSLNGGWCFSLKALERPIMTYPTKYLLRGMGSPHRLKRPCLRAKRLWWS